MKNTIKISYLVLAVIILMNFMFTSCNNTQTSVAPSVSPSVAPPESEPTSPSRFVLDEYPLFYREDGQWYFDPGIKAEEFPDYYSMNMQLEFESYDDFLETIRAEELAPVHRETCRYMFIFWAASQDGTGIWAPNPSLLEKCTFPFDPGVVLWGPEQQIVVYSPEYSDPRLQGYASFVKIKARPLDLTVPSDAESTVLDGRTVYNQDGTNNYTYFAEHEDATVMITWTFYHENWMGNIKVHVDQKDGLSFVYHCVNLPGESESDPVVYSSDVISYLENIRLTKNSAN